LKVIFGLDSKSEKELCYTEVHRDGTEDHRVIFLLKKNNRASPWRIGRLPERSRRACPEPCRRSHSRTEIEERQNPQARPVKLAPQFIVVGPRSQTNSF